MSTTAASPYTLDEPPTSTGRVFLARAFSHWCVLHYGHSPEEVEEALRESAQATSPTVRHIRFAARLIGELLAADKLKASARPFGGGTPSPILPVDWELDDFRPRMAASALDPARPFDAGAAPTHWIFLDLDDFNRLVEASCADVLPPSRAAGSRRRAPTPERNDDHTDESRPSEERHVRMPEIRQRTGMSASTVYRRIAQERFPTQIPMETGNIAAWRESDVAEWIANPR